MYLLNHKVAEKRKGYRVARRRMGQSQDHPESELLPDGTRVYHRVPTYAEASDYWKIPVATISSWWDHREKILEGTGFELPKEPTYLTGGANGAVPAGNGGNGGDGGDGATAPASAPVPASASTSTPVTQPPKPPKPPKPNKALQIPRAAVTLNARGQPQPPPPSTSPSQSQGQQTSGASEQPQQTQQADQADQAEQLRQAQQAWLARHVPQTQQTQQTRQTQRVPAPAPPSAPPPTPRGGQAGYVSPYPPVGPGPARRGPPPSTRGGQGAHASPSGPIAAQKPRAIAFPGAPPPGRAASPLPATQPRRSVTQPQPQHQAQQPQHQLERPPPPHHVVYIGKLPPAGVFLHHPAAVAGYPPPSPNWPDPWVVIYYGPPPPPYGDHPIPGVPGGLPLPAHSNVPLPSGPLPAGVPPPGPPPPGPSYLVPGPGASNFRVLGHEPTLDERKPRVLEYIAPEPAPRILPPQQQRPRPLAQLVPKPTPGSHCPAPQTFRAAPNHPGRSHVQPVQAQTQVQQRLIPPQHPAQQSSVGVVNATPRPTAAPPPPAATPSGPAVPAPTDHAVEMEAATPGTSSSDSEGAEESYLERQNSAAENSGSVEDAKDHEELPDAEEPEEPGEGNEEHTTLKVDSEQDVAVSEGPLDDPEEDTSSTSESPTTYATPRSGPHASGGEDLEIEGGDGDGGGGGDGDEEGGGDGDGDGDGDLDGNRDGDEDEEGDEDEDDLMSDAS